MKEFFTKNKKNKAEYQRLKDEIICIGLSKISMDMDSFVGYKEYYKIKLFLYKGGKIPAIPAVINLLSSIDNRLRFEYFYIQSVKHENDKVILNLIFI
jgi:hypothetical protein